MCSAGVTIWNADQEDERGKENIFFIKTEILTITNNQWVLARMIRLKKKMCKQYLNVSKKYRGL